MANSVPVGDLRKATFIESIIDDPTIEEKDIEKKLNETLQEFSNKRTKSSLETIFNISNTMMGSALLVMPINFYISGIISALIAATIMAIISYITANIVIIHSRDDEIDYPEAILRILGKPWQVVFNIMSMFLLYLVGLIHFVLMSETLYSILKNIFPNSSEWAPNEGMHFDKFSMSYVGLIMFTLCAILFSIRNLKSILTINDKGIYMVLIFCIFMAFIGINAITRLDISFVMTGEPGVNRHGLELILFDGNLGTLIGIFALAYMIHNSVVGMMKSNKDSSKNSRDLGIAYFLVFLFYAILGMIGALGVAGLYYGMYDFYQSKEQKLPRTIMELLVRNNPFLSQLEYIFGSIALGLIFIQLSTVIPILCFFTRRQFFDLIYGPKKRIPNAHFHLFNFFYNISCLVVEIFGWDINMIIGLSGAIGGFLLIYIIPIYLHMKCIYFAKPDDHNVTEAILPKQSGNNNKSVDIEENTTSEAKHMCRNHSDIFIKNKTVALIVYGILVLFGVAILGFLLYGLF